MSNPVTHKVVSGDTLFSLGKKYGLTVAELKSINNLTSDTIKIGQVLKLTQSSSNQSASLKYTVRLKVLIENKAVMDNITYKVFYLRNKKTAIEKFDKNGCSKVYDAEASDITWFEIYLSGKLLDKVFVTPTLSGKYNDNVYKIKTTNILPLATRHFSSQNSRKLKKVSFCEALELFIQNPSVWTSPTPPDLYRDEIGREINYIHSLGIEADTTDGVDLQYFLIQHRFRNTVDSFTGFFAWGGLSGYVVIFSGISAVHNNVGFSGYWKDVSNDLKGNMGGFVAASYGLEFYKKLHCGK